MSSGGTGQDTVMAMFRADQATVWRVAMIDARALLVQARTCGHADHERWARASWPGFVLSHEYCTMSHSGPCRAQRKGSREPSHIFLRGHASN